MKGALLREVGQPLEFADMEIPAIIPGAVRVKPIYSYVLNFANAVLGGHIPMKPPTPCVIGPACIAVVDDFAPDVVGFQKGQVVFVSPWMTSQINDPMTPPDGLIQGWFHVSPTTGVLDKWKNGTWSEYTLARSRNVYAVPEDLLQKGADTLQDLAMLNYYSIALGSLQKAGVDSFGKSVLVNGASGQLGQCAVHLSLAFGAREVYCVSRSEETLRKIFADFVDDPRLKFVTVETLPKMCCDAVIDFLGMVPTGEPTVKSIGALRPGGTIVFSGGVFGEIPLNYGQVLGMQLNIRGSLMYSPEAPNVVLGLLVSGKLKLPKRTYHLYPLAEANQAVAEAGQDSKRTCLIKISDEPE